MRVTLSTIAEKAGVARSSVAEILNGTTRPYAAETKRRVIQAAQDLNYRPNHAAVTLRSGRFGAIGLLSSDDPIRKGWLSQRLLDTTHRELEIAGMHLVYARWSDDRLTDDQLPSVLSRLLVDGLLVNYIQAIPVKMLQLIADSGLPVVYVNAPVHRPCVYHDDVSAGARAVEELAAAGHRRIAYLDPVVHEHHSYHDRWRGYVDAMVSRGLEPIDLRQTCVLDESLMEFCQSQLRSWCGATAVIVNGVRLAVAMHASAIAHQWSVPGELSMVAIGDVSLSQMIYPISTIDVPFDMMAKQATALLRGMINGQQSTDSSVLIQPQWHSGRTIGPARSKGSRASASQ